MQNAAGSSGAYPVQTATDGYGVAYQSNPYAGSMLAYDQQYVPSVSSVIMAGMCADILKVTAMDADSSDI